MTNYGKLIKAAREKAGFTQEQLGAEIGVTGVTIMRYEKGQRTPSSKIIGEIARVLGTDFAVSVIDEVSHSVAKAVERKQREDEDLEARHNKLMAAWKAAEDKAGHKLTRQEAMDFYRFDTEIYVRLNDVIKKLNNEGRKVALERIEELTLIDKYTLPDIEKHLPTHTTEVPQKETAPEG